jgi:hypothetical protein
MSTSATRLGPTPRPSNHSSFGVPSLTTSTTRNPLNLKVNRLLSANLEDAGTRAALDTLGEFERQAVQDGTPATKGGIGGALRRGGLRKEVEGRMAEGSREFLEAFSEVNDVSLIGFCDAERELTGWLTRQKLSVLQSHLDAMHVCCNEVQTQLEKANTGTRYLLEHAEGLRQQR